MELLNPDGSIGESSELRALYEKAAEEVREERGMLLKALNAIQFIINEQQTNTAKDKQVINDFHDLLEHYKRLNFVLLPNKSLPNNRFSAGEFEIIYTYDELLKLKKEGLSTEADLAAVLDQLSQKYDRLKGVSLS